MVFNTNEMDLYVQNVSTTETEMTRKKLFIKHYKEPIFLYYVVFVINLVGEFRIRMVKLQIYSIK